MMRVNVADAGVNLMTLIRLIQSGKESSVVLVEDGKPVAKMEEYAEEPDGRHIKFGIAKGELKDSGMFNPVEYNVALTPEEVSFRTSMKDGKRIGIAEGKLKYPDDIHAFDNEIAELFGV